jgi:hypothetical protein
MRSLASFSLLWLGGIGHTGEMGNGKKIESGNGGSSHDRRSRQRQSEHSGDLQQIVSVEDTGQSQNVSRKERKQQAEESKKRRSELLNFASFGLGCASWGWSVIAPDSSAVFGSVLLLAAVVFFLMGLQRVWTVGKVWFALICVAFIAGYGVFDWYVVVKPQRGKPFKELLVEGYHLTNECQTVPGKTQMPDWMRDQSKEWQARVQQLISEKLSANDAQTWQGAIILGRVSDEKLNSYQCTWLANKVGALETIVAANYDPKLKHRDYNGPTYWFDVVNDKVDISDALNDAIKHHNGKAAVVFNGNSEDSGDAQPQKPQQK